MSLVVLWVIVALVAGILEVIVPAFGFIFVTLAALATAVLAWLQLGLGFQVVIFAALSLALIVVLRPVFLKRLGPGVPDRTDALKGKLAEVTESINPVRGTGRVIVEGHDWAARAPLPIATGSRVRVVGADGIVLLVSPV
jgi:membrane protein implicated in regulation of membrane protease activity